MSGRYERSARFWLHAYPQRWRDAHGEEALALLLDLAPPVPDGGRAPRWIGAREAWGLVRAGWGLRWREHPPLGRWLLYRALDVRLPARYWWWVADDIHGALYAWRNGAFNGVLLLQITYGLPLFGMLLGDEYVVHLPTWCTSRRGSSRPGSSSPSSWARPSVASRSPGPGASTSSRGTSRSRCRTRRRRPAVGAPLRWTATERDGGAGRLARGIPPSAPARSRRAARCTRP